MTYYDVKPGKDIPNIINAVIEVPAYTSPVKYEMDKESGMLFVDRFLPTPVSYPANYGFIPRTLAEDDDPADVLVITPLPLIHGSIITCRPVGLFRMTDEKGKDAKILAVPADHITHFYKNVRTYKDLPKAIIQAIEHFFAHYKDLEPEKWVRIDGWEDVDSAKQEIIDSVKRYQETAS